ncbi:MAG: hypothetical protein U0871_01060 [Gemmataceae bacterium]
MTTRSRSTTPSDSGRHGCVELRADVDLPAIPADINIPSSSRPIRRDFAERTRTKADLLRVREKADMQRVLLKVTIVQPGLSKAKITDEQLELLAVTENYLMETYNVPFRVVVSP